MVEHRLAQIRHHALADPGHQVEAAVGRRRQQQDDDQQNQQRRIEQPGIAAAESLVDQGPQPLAERQHGAGGDDQRQRRPGGLRQVRPDEAEQRRQRTQVVRLRPLLAQAGVHIGGMAQGLSFPGNRADRLHIGDSVTRALASRSWPRARAAARNRSAGKVPIRFSSSAARLPEGPRYPSQDPLCRRETGCSPNRPL